MPRMQGENLHINGRCHPWCGDVDYVKGRAREKVETQAEIGDYLADQEIEVERQVMDWPSLCPKCHMPSRDGSEDSFVYPPRLDGYCWPCLVLEEDGYPE